MADMKKEQERDELHRSIWAIADELRGTVDDLDFMILGDVKDHDIDASGNAYEYLMTIHTSNACKSGGEFFTAMDVSKLPIRLGTVRKIEKLRLAI